MGLGDLMRALRSVGCSLGDWPRRRRKCTKSIMTAWVKVSIFTKPCFAGRATIGVVPWPFGVSFPSILGFWVFISFHFSLLGLHVL